VPFILFILNLYEAEKGFYDDFASPRMLITSDSQPLLIFKSSCKFLFLLGRHAGKT
jgi:hypothetical protein